MSAELQASRHDASLILTLSNPGANNALHPDIYAAAIETLSTAERDHSIRAVVLTGAGGQFCSGETPARLPKDGRTSLDSLDPLQGWIDAIRGCPKPVIAAVEGIAANAGFSLALACDFLVAGASAEFSMDQVINGLTPRGGGSWFLTQVLPRQLVAEILITGVPISAPRLQELGLINKLEPDGSALEAALTWAQRLTTLPPNTIERIKSLVDEAQSNTLAQHIASERRHFIECQLLHDKDK